MLKLSLTDEDEDDDDNEGVDALDGSLMTKTTVTSGPCSLDRRTQLLIMIIFSEDMFTGQMSSMHLGKVPEP